jgi:hypothetical protein
VSNALQLGHILDPDFATDYPIESKLTIIDSIRILLCLIVIVLVFYFLNKKYKKNNIVKVENVIPMQNYTLCK